jgi:hypothetical protein
MGPGGRGAGRGAGARGVRCGLPALALRLAGGLALALAGRQLLQKLHAAGGTAGRSGWAAGRGVRWVAREAVGGQ